MNLLDNPFHVLGASPRDDRRRILELAEERSLASDAAACSEARAALTNPRNRLAAEVAWLPGLGSGWDGQIAELLRNAASSIRTMQGLPSLAKANLLAAALPRIDNARKADELPEAIVELASLLDACDTEKIRALINEERAASGFPEVRETSAVAEALAERRNHYRTAIKNALDELPTLALVRVVTEVVTETTARGARHAPVLIDDMVDTYEVEAQRFLDAEAKNVELLVAAVRRCLAEKRSPELLQRLLSRIKEVVTNWDMVAQPIQLSAMGRGLDHALSHRVAGQVRDLGVELFNEHGLLEQSKFLTALLQDSFQEVPRVADATQQDADALGEIARKQDAAKREFERAITYSARLGPTRSEVFRISPEGIEWQGVRWPLEAITRIRWGGIASQLSGHPQFLVSFGNAERSSDVIVFEPEVFTAITDRLWRAVGPRLTVEMLTRLRRGAELRFGQVTVTDTEVQVGRSRGPWSNVGLGSRNGHLEITLQQPYNRGSLPFLEVDNAHVLAFVLGNALEQKLDRLSKLLRD